MPRVCTVCGHPRRPDIDRALVDGVPYRVIAKRYEASPAAVQRHKDHVPATLARARDAADVADADNLLGQLQELRAKALELLDKAERAGDYRTALAGVREARGCVETLLEVSGELDRRGVVNIVVSPQWIELRTVILSALRGHPEARRGVVTALRAVEGGTT